MPLRTHDPATDLYMPLANGRDWDPHTIHTHYFGFSVPEHALSAFLYIRCQPTFELCSAGVSIFRGMKDNVRALEVEYLDWVVTLPYPEVSDAGFTTGNGLSVRFLEPGRTVQLRYRAPDGSASFDLVQEALTPLIARGHVMPGEDEDSDPANRPGGTEQFMHCRGEVQLYGERYDVDCFPARDRSWCQVRAETEKIFPPVGWSPMWFGDDLAFNQVGWEPLDTEPAWQGLFDVPADAPSHYFGWLYSSGELLDVVRVRRNVLEYHPELGMAVRQDIEAEDERGRIHRFRGEAVATATVPSWPNNAFFDSLYRWESDDGRVTHCTYQETWYRRYQRALRERRRSRALA